jgi:hypothetical protein
MGPKSLFLSLSLFVFLLSKTFAWLQDNSKGQGRSRRVGRKQKDGFEIRVNASDTIRSVKSQVCIWTYSSRPTTALCGPN